MQSISETPCWCKRLSLALTIPGLDNASISVTLNFSELVNRGCVCGMRCSHLGGMHGEPLENPESKAEKAENASYGDRHTCSRQRLS